jgi:hypothetical protein
MVIVFGKMQCKQEHQAISSKIKFIAIKSMEVPISHLEILDL